ncbi:hypothetical protein PInf_011115 [Phytophthora infestans]|nr:hypothetical protein PInf_011115 [Phytophthora infestans]
MSRHDPYGSLLCIHSVVVDQTFRRRGFATQPHVKRIMLISKAKLVGFYLKCGFSVTRLSLVVHGQDPWLELSLDCEKARLPPLDTSVDAFSSEPFQDNPAAVVLLTSAVYHKEGASKWMQRVAMENNLSETAYAAPRARTSQTANDVVEYDLRWFTPGTEVKLCEHTTLSTALAVNDAGHVTSSQTLHFHTLSGLLVCRFEVQSETQKLLVLMDFPEEPTTPAGPCVVLKELASALGIQPNVIVDVK